MRTLVLGGIRSGKSSHAERLITAATASPRVRYVATAAPPAVGDPEWADRIRDHRDRRPATWTTVESADLAETLRSDPHTPTLVDDLGHWVSAHIDRVGGWDDPALDLTDQVDRLCSALTDFTGELVLVSPEVGLSLVAPTPAGRRFQDELGRVNERVAELCDRVVLMIAGRPLSVSAAASAASAHPPAEPIHTEPIHPEPTAVPDDEMGDDAVHASADAGTPPPPTTDGVFASDPEEFDVVATPDLAVGEQAVDRQRALTKPPGSLGRLEDLSVWVAQRQGVCPPHPFRDATVVVFAGDHGVARGGVSAYPPEVTAQMVANILSGGAAVNVLAAHAGARVRVEDIAVDADTDPTCERFKVRRGCGDLRVEDTLTDSQTRTALAHGRAIADELVDSGADLLIAGDLGIGNTTPAAVLIGLIAGAEPVVVVGRGTGVDDAGWMRKTAAIRDGMRRGRRVLRSPSALLAAVAGADLTAMAGFLAQCALRRTPVILDGVVVTAAALVAQELAPGAARWWLAGHRSAEPAHAIALAHLELEPVLDFGMRLGEGSGALTALPILQAAVATLTSMATFDSAGVSDRSDRDSEVVAGTAGVSSR